MTSNFIISFQYGNIKVPCERKYGQGLETQYFSLYYNATRAPNPMFTSPASSIPFHDELNALLTSIYEGIAASYGKPISIDPSYQPFPLDNSRITDNYDIVSMQGGFYFIFPSLFCFVIVMQETVREKELHLRKSLQILGMRRTAYWLSLLFTSFVISIISSLMLLICGLLFGYSVFWKTPFLISFSLYFLLSFSMQMLGLFCSTVIKSSKTAYSFSYGFILFALIIQGLLMDIHIIRLVCIDTDDWLISILLLCCKLYPPFSFTKSYSMIVKKAGNTFDYSQSRFVEGPGYNWEDMMTPMNGRIDALDANFYVNT